MTAARCFFVLTLAVGVAAATGCADPAAPYSGVEVSLAAPDYALELEEVAAVIYSVRNTGPSVVLVTSRCGDGLSPSIQRRQDGEWQQYRGGACVAALDMSPVPLSPGASRTDSVLVDARGEYRLVVGTEQGQAISPVFVVR